MVHFGPWVMISNRGDSLARPHMNCLSFAETDMQSHLNPESHHLHAMHHAVTETEQ